MINFSKREQTTIKKSADGWTGETKLNAAGQNWIISTAKYGRNITTYARAVEPHGRGFSFVAIGRQPIKLLTVEATATETKVKALHLEALAAFDTKIEAGEIEPPAKNDRPQIGTIIYTMGPGYDARERVVYEIDGPSFKTVLLDGSGFNVDQFVKPAGSCTSIGAYFDPSAALVSTDAIIDLLDYTRHNLQTAALLEAAQSQLAEAERADKLAEGQKIAQIPADAKTVIIAELFEDESDTYTDYFHCRAVKTVILGYSKSMRNNPAELRKMAARFDKTAELLNDPAAKIDRGYNGLPSYYFGTRNRYGWKVSKEKYSTLPTTGQGKESIYIAAAEGRYYAETIVPTAIADTVKPDTGTDTPSGALQIVEYSEKAVAVIGDTYAHRAALRSLGGRFNKFLKVDGKTVAGWIFAKKMRAELEQLAK